MTTKETPSFGITIRTLTHKDIPLSVHPNTTILGVKGFLEGTVNVPVAHQFLFHGDTALEDNLRHLEDYGVASGDTLDLFLSLQGEEGHSHVFLLREDRHNPNAPVVRSRQEVIFLSKGVSGVGEVRMARDTARFISDAQPFVVRAEHLRNMDPQYCKVVDKVADLEQWKMDHHCMVSVLHEGHRSGPPFEARTMKMSEFILKHLDVADPTLYLQQVPIADSEVLMNWLGEGGLPPVPMGLKPDASASCLYAGGPGITTSLHFDSQNFSHGPASVDNLFTQCRGRKKVTLWRPYDHNALYPRGKEIPEGALRPGSKGWKAATNPEDLQMVALEEAPFVSRICDLELAAAVSGRESSWPGFAEAYARKLEVTLEAGDMIYIPRWWWHQWTSLTAGTAINCWFTFQGLDDPDHSQLNYEVKGGKHHGFGKRRRVDTTD